MALFINHHGHPHVFKNNSSIIEPNQRYYHQDNFSDMISEQKVINQTLSNAFQDLKVQYQQERQENIRKWRDIASQMQVIRDRGDEQKTFEREMTAKLDQNNATLQHVLEHDATQRTNTAEQVEALSAENQAIVKRLAASETSNQAVILQVYKLTDINDRMQEELTERERVQRDVLGRLESQEALMEKVHRQLSEFRAILYERSSYLAEKIEDNYHLTSSYVYKLVSGTDQPLAWYVGQRKAGSDNEEG